MRGEGWVHRSIYVPAEQPEQDSNISKKGFIVFSSSLPLYQKDSCSAICYQCREGVSNEQDSAPLGISAGGSSDHQVRLVAGQGLSSHTSQHPHSVHSVGTGTKTSILAAFQQAIICLLENKTLILTLVFQTEHDICTALDKACKYKYNKKPQ